VRFKKVTYKKLLKFTPENLTRTIRYMCWIRNIPWERLVFLDESRFDSDLMVQKGVSEKGTRLEAVDSSQPSARQSWTVTLACRLGAVPIAIPAMHQGTNDAVEFGTAVNKLISDGFIRPGDYVVLDNAAIHKKPRMLDPLNDLLTTLGAQLMFLPTYSPEFNPCELIFGKVKDDLRHHRGLLAFCVEVVRSFCKITFQDVFMFFSHCITI